jgi:hypothetical protein
MTRRRTRHTGEQLHAHIAYHGADCDGPTGRDWVEELTVDEAHEAATYEDYVRAGLATAARDDSEYLFKTRVMSMCISYYVDPACRPTAVQITNDGLTVDKDTEEGYSRYEVQWCDDDCNAEARGAYDRFAEAMGY